MGTTPQINVIDFNRCTQSCDCGWSITVGSKNIDALKELKVWLKKCGYVELTDHSKKITSNPIGGLGDGQV